MATNWNPTLAQLKAWCEKHPKHGKVLTQVYLDIRRQKTERLRAEAQAKGRL